MGKKKSKQSPKPKPKSNGVASPAPAPAASTGGGQRARRTQQSRAALRRQETNVYMVFALSIISACLMYFSANMHKMDVPTYPQDASRAAAKPYTTFEAFFPFYLRQHADPTCRLLHVVGTSIVLFNVSFLKRKLLMPGMIALNVGYILCHVFSPLDNGLYEFAAIVATLTLMAGFNYQNFAKAIKDVCGLLIVGYGFAWIGHYYFEQNTPATFIYPTFSFLGDMLMWMQTVSGQLPLDWQAATQGIVAKISALIA
jgi:hypothetical protein